METATSPATSATNLKHALDNQGNQLATEEAQPKKAKLDNVPNAEKHTITTESAPWISSEIATASHYITDYLKSTPALSIIKERGAVFEVKADHHAGQAISLMSKENILSCPVYDKELEANVGFVDFMDITTLVVDVIHKVVKDDFADFDSLASLDVDQHHRLLSLTKVAFNHKTLFDISDLSKSDPYHAVPKGCNLYQAIELLAKSGIHRVPIENDDQKIEAILSQSAVIDFLFDNLAKFATKAKEPVTDIVGKNASVITVKESSLAFEAFESMVKNKVTAVGVVDDSGKLTGVISSTDMRMIGPHANSAGILLQSAKEMYDRARELNKWTVLPVVTTSMEETLGIVIEKMQDNFVHRVFVVDDNENPVAVISMKDVLMQFL